GEEGAQIAIGVFADTGELVLASARVLLRHEPDPGREIPTRSKSLRISNAGDQSGGQRGTHAGNLIQSLARLIGSMTGNNLTVEVEDLRFQRPQLAPRARRQAREISGSRLSLTSATTSSSCSTPLRPTGATMPNSAR